MFIDNKYTKWYNIIIANAITRNLTKGIEKHHIIPHSCGGSNDDSNMVPLTLREHYICHLLLTKMLLSPYKEKMLHAVWWMSNARKGLKVNSKIYEMIRRDSANAISEKLTGRTQSAESIAKRVATVTGVKKPKTSATMKGVPRPYVSEALKGRKQSQEVIDKRAAALRGKPSGALGRTQTDEEKALRSSIMKGRESPKKGTQWSAERRAAHELSKQRKQDELKKGK